MAFVPIDIRVLAPGELQLSVQGSVDTEHVLEALRARFGPRLVVMHGRRPRAAVPFRVRVHVGERGVICRHDRSASHDTREQDLTTVRGALTDAALRATWRRAA